MTREQSDAATQQRQYSMERFTRLSTVATGLLLLSIVGLYYNGQLPVEFVVVLTVTVGIMTFASAKLWYDLRKVRLNE